MPRVLAVADEVEPALWTGSVHRYDDVDLVLAAGDLPFDYIDHIASTLGLPCVLVPGNHDADLAGFRNRSGVWYRDGMPAEWPGPPEAVNADGRVVRAAGLRIAGLGGCVRYRPGPNQWTQAHQSRRAWLLRIRAALGGGGVDIVLTHAPPRHCGDREDPAHHGFECLHGLVRALRPALLVHGHIHPFGMPVPDRRLGDTLVVNVVGHRVLDLGRVRDAA
ncbi:MAG TPA: metallophosphoesterase [Pseudonocardiaceae bacterium]